MEIFEYKITELTTSLDYELASILRKVYDAGFDSISYESFPNGWPKMARFQYSKDYKTYTVYVDANGEMGEVSVRAR